MYQVPSISHITNMERERGKSMAMGQDEEVKMELELDAAHALANLAGADPVSNQSSISHEEEPHQLQEKVGENSKEVKGNMSGDQTLERIGSDNSNQSEVPSLRGQKKLNEAERDARRLRRILANRESARQTILRRQAFRDELARKVSILSAENLVLKQEKEDATMDYLYQKEMNQKLKEQMQQITPLTKEKILEPPPFSAAPEPVIHSMPACAITNEATSVIREVAAEDVSCSLTLSIGNTEGEITERKHEVMSKKKLNQLQLKVDSDKACSPYLLLDAADARRRRMEIARLRHLNRY